MKFYRQLGVIFLGLGLTNCLEPQAAPKLDRPVQNFTISTLASNLDTPWSVTPLPRILDDNVVNTPAQYLITERDGQLKLLGGDGEITILTGLPDDIFARQQGGLFEVVLAPDFTQSRKIFISYARGTRRANGTVIISAKLGDTSITDLQDVFVANPFKNTGSHFGGRMVILPDDSLVLTLGDGFTYREAVQDKESHLGKIIRIYLDGSTPKDNPFVGDADLDLAIAGPVYSYGHRNVQGLSYDKTTNILWSHEHGPRGGDELNLIKPGQNYGWPLATTGVDYNGARISPFKSLEGTEAFVKDWVPSIAPSGLVVYNGDLFKDWQGDIFVGGLASRDVRHLEMDGTRFVNETSLLSELDGRVRDVKQDLDGALLVVIEDSNNGQLLRLTPTKPAAISVPNK